MITHLIDKYKNLYPYLNAAQINWIAKLEHLGGFLISESEPDRETFEEYADRSIVLLQEHYSSVISSLESELYLIKEK